MIFSPIVLISYVTRRVIETDVPILIEIHEFSQILKGYVKHNLSK